MIAEAASRLERAGVAAARAEAQLLLARLLGTDRGGVAARGSDPVDDEIGARFADWVARRERREPFQHITGSAEFHGLEMRVDARALIPRPETEGIVDAALEREPLSLADLGTGSGCIAVALAVRRTELRVHALDRSGDALELARENARAHGVESRVELRSGDMAAPPEEWRAAMDVVVSNPPYVAEDAWRELEPEVRDHDPREALVPGPTGLEAYPQVARGACELLRPDGVLIVELGQGQAAAVREIFARHGLQPLEVRSDLRGIERVLIARLAPGERA